jgi:hypothetical protein
MTFERKPRRDNGFIKPGVFPAEPDFTRFIIREFHHIRITEYRAFCDITETSLISVSISFAEM